MAELIDLRYHPGRTPLHDLDARIKVAGMAVCSAASLSAGSGAMILACLALAIAGYPMRRTMFRLFLRLKIFLILLLCIWLSRALTTPGEPFFDGTFFIITRAGMASGLMVCWRLAFVVILSLLVTATTPVHRIRAAIDWWLRRIPFVPRQVIGDMVGLMIRFIPIIFICSQKISEAQSSRGIRCRRNPFFRLRVYSLALLRHCFLAADLLSEAMAARSYNTCRPVPAWPMRRRDWFWLSGVVLLGLTLIMF